MSSVSGPMGRMRLDRWARVRSGSQPWELNGDVAFMVEAEGPTEGFYAAK